jgi:putative DNA-invertase from lambdoid prophage Rac
MPWHGSLRPPPRNMMHPAWPERIDCGQADGTSRSGRQTGLSEREIAKGFWPGTETGENVSGGPVCPRLYNDQQTIPLQIRALREYATRRGGTIALQVKEVGSGAAQRHLREQLMDTARRRGIDIILVGRLDRWGRSVAELLTTLQELEHLGVGFVSLTEALDPTTPAGRAMAGMLAIFAGFERDILRERVRAGWAHARQNGKKLGRPITAGRHTEQVRKLYRTGVSKSEIARRLQIGRTSVRRILG